MTASTRRMGHVYFATVGSEVKIGFSSELPIRMLSLKREYPAIKLVGFVAGTMRTEKTFHEKFSSLLVRGREWFANDAELRSFMTQLPASDMPEVSPQTNFKIPLHLLKAIKSAALDRQTSAQVIIVEAVAKQLGVTL